MRLSEIIGPGEVAVIGLGRSGVAAVRLLRHEGIPVYASDLGTGAGVDGSAAALRALGAAVDTGGHDLVRIGKAILAVLSPGVPPDAPPVAAARAAGIPIWAEAELGLRALGGAIPYVAITGTNGKTTTTSLVGHLLNRAGRRARTVGNIGTPVSEVALLSERPTVLAIELSSFQLHDMPTVSPTVGIVTNLAPDHLDRYPDIDEYYRDKARIAANAAAQSFWITNDDNPISDEWIRPSKGRRRRFSVVTRADGWYDRMNGLLKIGDTTLVERSRFPLLGDHNVANALAASLAVHALGVSAATIESGLRTVSALKHRMEPIREVGQVLWINDSKATNLSSTEVALRATTRPFVLLLGGRHKGESYGRLADLLDNCRAVVAYGEARPIIIRDLADRVKIATAGSFDQVMATAAKLAQPGDVVLLSPACSSYDMFANYEGRGARFRQIVEAM